LGSGGNSLLITFLWVDTKLVGIKVAVVFLDIFFALAVFQIFTTIRAPCNVAAGGATPAASTNVSHDVF
jgi:hypothetical protein